MFYFFKSEMKVTKQLNIKEKEVYFFSDMINIFDFNNFDLSLLIIDRTALDHDFIIYYVKTEVN